MRNALSSVMKELPHRGEALKAKVMLLDGAVALLVRARECPGPLGLLPALPPPISTMPAAHQPLSAALLPQTTPKHEVNDFDMAALVDVGPKVQRVCEQWRSRLVSGGAPGGDRVAGRPTPRPRARRTALTPPSPPRCRCRAEAACGGGPAHPPQRAVHQRRGARAARHAFPAAGGAAVAAAAAAAGGGVSIRLCGAGSPPPARPGAPGLDRLSPRHPGGGHGRGAAAVAVAR